MASVSNITLHTSKNIT